MKNQTTFNHAEIVKVLHGNHQGYFGTVQGYDRTSKEYEVRIPKNGQVFYEKFKIHSLESSDRGLV